MKKIPNKWVASCGLFIFGALLTLRSRNQPGLFDISDTTQMLIVLACSILVFLILHLKENKNGRK